MADAASESGKSESMEDILQSIKRIIEDDGGAQSTPAATAADAGPDVFDLTQMVKDDGSVAPLSPLPKANNAPAPASQDVIASIDAMFDTPATSAPTPAPTMAAPAPVPPPTTAPKPVMMEDGLVSDQAASAAIAALKPIAETAVKDYSIPHIPSTGLRGGNTVEDLILEALRPMLKSWLDENLPTIVHKIVEKEVKRIVTFHHD